jgi:uncharacterized coiled-coil DUF342 family protein
MNLKRRIDQLENQAEHYQEKMLDQKQDVDKVTVMIRAIGRKGLAEILRRIDGKTRGLPSQR